MNQLDYRLRILIDFDNVTVMSADLKAWFAEFLFGITVPSSMFRKRLLVDTEIAAMRLLTKDQYHAIRYHVYKNAHTYRRLKPVPGSLPVLRALLADGHFVACVTSQQGFGLTIAEKYFALNKLPIASYGVGYGKSKAKKAAGLKADAFFDDDPPKLLKLTEVVPYLFLHEWAYNRSLPVDPNLIERVGIGNDCAWEKFYERIIQIESLRKAFIERHRAHISKLSHLLANDRRFFADKVSQWCDTTKAGSEAWDEALVFAKEKLLELQKYY